MPAAFARPAALPISGNAAVELQQAQRLLGQLHIRARQWTSQVIHLDDHRQLLLRVGQHLLLEKWIDWRCQARCAGGARAPQA
jgi:hypothetical protein